MKGWINAVAFAICGGGFIFGALSGNAGIAAINGFFSLFNLTLWIDTLTEQFKQKSEQEES